MSGRFGGGGVKCTVCDKTSYAGETISFEKKPYHVECFRCSTCSKKMEGAAKAAQFEDTIYCHSCFAKGGFAQKQKKVVWTPKESTSTGSSKFGGGGTPCTACKKSVYPAEAVSYDKQVYHTDCLACSNCAKVCTVSGVAKFEDHIFCTKCFDDGGYRHKQAAVKRSATTSTTSSAMSGRFGGGGTPCTSCQKSVYPAEAVSYDKQVYHSDCLKCTTCSKVCTVSGVAQYEKDLYCTKCFSDGGFRQKQANVKKSTTTSTGVSAKFSKFGGGGNKCIRCTKTVYPAETVQFEKEYFHVDCFTCVNCSNKLSAGTACYKKDDENKLQTFCKKCWNEGGHGKTTLKPTHD